MAVRVVIQLSLIACLTISVLGEAMHRSQYGYSQPQRYPNIQYRPRTSYQSQRTYYQPRKTYQTYDPRALGGYGVQQTSYGSYQAPRYGKETIYIQPRPTYQPAPKYTVAQTYKPQPKYEAAKSNGYDPCSNLHEGDYVLSGEFKSLFPYVDSRCYFIKCANYHSFLNPCGVGTRNDEYGEGFCSHLDYEGNCGLALGEYHKHEAAPGYEGGH